MIILSLCLITLAMLVDFVSFILGVRRLRGDGPSGVPVIGFCLFGLGALSGHLGGHLDWPDVKYAVGVYAIFHISIQFGILFLLHLYVSDSRAE